METEFIPEGQKHESRAEEIARAQSTMALIIYAGAKYPNKKLTQQVKNHADVPAEIEGVS